MAINFEDIKQNFFINYLKYWIIFLLILLIYFFNSIRGHYFGTNNITANVNGAIYITSGVAINNRYVIASRSIVETACFNELTKLRGNFYVVDNRSIYRAVVDQSDPLNDMILLRLKNNQDALVSYAILENSKPKYSLNRRFIVPVVLNKPGTFDFKLARMVSDSDNVFFVAVRNILNRQRLSGMPIFNRNYVMQGVIREEDNEYNGMTKRDKILNAANIQTTYLVNDINIVKSFLNRYGIEYYVIDGNTDLDNEKYNPKNSVVNIICVQEY